MIATAKASFSRFRRRVGYRLATPIIVRLTVGRWPDAGLSSFMWRKLADERVNLPPLFRGVIGLQSGPDLLRHATSYLWHMEHGSLDPTGPPDLGGNLYTAWTGPGLGFVHIEKCGGIALMHWLSRAFHPEQINPDDHRDLPPHLCYRTPAFAGIDTARYSMIWGHYDAPTLARLAPSHLLFTMLREPRARLLSLYHFWRSVAPAQLDSELSFSVMTAHRLPLEDFLNCDDPMLVDLIDNVYVRRLTGLYATGAAVDPVLAAPDAALDAAFRVLDSIAFAGITEQMNASAVTFAAKLGIAPPAESLRANVTAENHTDPSGWFRAAARSELTPRVEALLDRRCALDSQIYARAVARFKGK